VLRMQQRLLVHMEEVMVVQVLLDMELLLLDTALVQHTVLELLAIVLLLIVPKAMERRPDMDLLLVIQEATSVSR
jgi:hypothetical protein